MRSRRYKTSFFTVIVFLCLLHSNPVNSQQKPVYSQYMFNGLMLNPAYAAVNDYLNVTSSYRDQWVNMEGAPSTTTISAHSGLKDKNIGLGILIVNDRIGMHDEKAIYGSYAFKIRLPEGSLSMGLQAGLNHLKSDPALLELEEYDPAFAETTTSSKINFGAGLYYNHKKFYAGASIPYLRKKREIRDGEYLKMATESRYCYVVSGLVVDVSRNMKLKPSVLLRIQEGMPIATDLNINAYLDDVLNIGMSYRWSDSFITLFELKLTDYIRFGYAYDWIMSDLSGFTAGTHEFTLNYRINLYAPKKHRMCPGPLYY